jgi:hypothetical protein
MDCGLTPEATEMRHLTACFAAAPPAIGFAIVQVPELSTCLLPIKFTRSFDHVLRLQTWVSQWLNTFD